MNELQFDMTITLDNHHVEAKIRQQLQYLRDRGFIAFDAPGCYKKLS